MNESINRSIKTNLYSTIASKSEVHDDGN